MNKQEALNRIEELLRARKDKNPKARAAWEAITVPVKALAGARIDRVPRDISDWPEGAVLGLLEHDVCETLGWEAHIWLFTDAPPCWQARMTHIHMFAWHSGATRNEALAAAMIAALEARTCGSPSGGPCHGAAGERGEE